jgi:probable rRNA maturation factor
MYRINLYVGSRYPVNRKKIRQTAMDFLKDKGIEHIELDISIVGKRKIKELNESQLKHEGATDVLSFPQHERGALNDFPTPPGYPPHLGEIFICFPVALDQARKYGKMVDDQICFFLEHGLMHLMGYHHE